MSAASRDMSHMVLGGLVCLPDLTENVVSSDPNLQVISGEEQKTGEDAQQAVVVRRSGDLKLHIYKGSCVKRKRKYTEGGSRTDRMSLSETNGEWAGQGLIPRSRGQ